VNENRLSSLEKTIGNDGTSLGHKADLSFLDEILAMTGL